LWGDTVFWSFDALGKASIGFELSPMFLGVGYLIGPRIAAIMLTGGLLGWAVLIPFFALLGGGLTWFGLPADLGSLEGKEIWRQAVRYVGAGAVAAGGLVSLVRAAPAMRSSIGNLLASVRRPIAAGPRSERDLPGSVVLGGVTILTLALWVFPAYHLTLL